VKIIVTPETKASAAPIESAVGFVVPTVVPWSRRAKRLIGSKNS
jgi:hypothetical protein